MNKKKITVAVASIVIVAVAIAGIVFVNNHDDQKTVTVKTSTTNSQGQQQTETRNVEVTKAADIKSTLAAWKAAGLTVSDDQGAYYQVVNAKNGGKYDVGQTNVELYEFSDSSKANDAKTSYFTSESDTVLVTGSLLIDIHSVDAVQVDAIKAVF